jgi:hypothetical protein
MSPDDFIMLFTDGLFEVQAPDQQIYSRERLEIALRHRVSLPSAKILTELLGEIREFSKHNEFTDDVCLLGVDVKRYEHRIANKDSTSERAQRPTAVKPRGRAGNCESCYQPESLFFLEASACAPLIGSEARTHVGGLAESSTPTTPPSTN